MYQNYELGRIFIQNLKILVKVVLSILELSPKNTYMNFEGI
jgi:hypothetical protein